MIAQVRLVLQLLWGEIGNERAMLARRTDLDRVGDVSADANLLRHASRERLGKLAALGVNDLETEDDGLVELSALEAAAKWREGVLLE